MAIAAAVCGGTGSNSESPAAIPEPSVVQAYVAAHWDRYGIRFANQASQGGLTFKLASVSDVRCSSAYGAMAACDFKVRAVSPYGVAFEQTLTELFQRRADGTFGDIVVMIQERVRR